MIIDQITTLKQIDMEPRQAIPKKHFISEEENNCEEEINLSPQDRNGNIDWHKCGCEKPVATFAEIFSLLLRVKSRSARGASYHSAFMGNWPTISHTC